METWGPPGRAGDAGHHLAPGPLVLTCRCQIRDKLAWNRKPGLRRQISGQAKHPVKISPMLSAPRWRLEGLALAHIAEGDPRVPVPGCGPGLEQRSSQELPVTNDQVDQTQQCKQ